MPTLWYQAIHTAKRFRLGTTKSQNGQVFIYGAGVASNAVGSWVVFDSAGVNAYVPVLAVADAQGKVAISQSANTSATNYSWYAIYGRHSGLCLASFDGTNGAGVWLTSTAGSVDDTSVDGDVVYGCMGLTDRNTTTGLSTFDLSYPYVLDIATASL